MSGKVVKKLFEYSKKWRRTDDALHHVLLLIVYLVDYPKLITAVKIVEPAMAISINQTTIFVTLENVLVFLSFIDHTHPYSLLPTVYILLLKSATRNFTKGFVSLACG